MRVLAVFVAALSAVSAATVSTSATKGAVKYDTVYDNAKLSTSTIACSDGKNGLATKGYKTLGKVPSFPYVGAAPAIEGWNSKNCGTCWRVSYGGRSIFFTALDHSKTVTLSKAAMNKLTNGQAVKLGTVQASYQQVAPKKCGF